MDNRQLAVLIAAWANRLEREISLVRNDLPADLQKIYDKDYRAGLIDNYYVNPNTKGEENISDFEILEGLKELHEEMTNAIKTLSG